MSNKRTTNDPWHPTKVEDTPRKVRVSGLLSKEDVRAIKNCWDGTANEYEQRLALQAIIYGIARVADSTYHRGEDGARDSAFHEGMRHVGKEVQKFAELGNVYLIDKTKPE